MAEFPIVGIGSSAGGLEALQILFRAMPDDGGLGFVIAAHLDPTQKSLLAELLGRCTRMPVVQIEDRIRVEPNHVYVIAPDQELTIKDGVLQAHKPTAPRGHRHPVDFFFRSLAADQGERAIAIVLSGTGTNGSLGLRFIKAEGGIAIVQDPETASFQGMPRSAIGIGIVDLVLPPDKMPEALLGLARHPYVQQPAKAVADSSSEGELKSLLALLRAQAHRDFSGYKQRTLLRRIHRRMGLHRINSLGNYAERLRRDADEVKALVADLTINVTGFFRDPEAWETLAREVVAPLVQERPAESTIRAWVPGCSTGEEAYSIAMLLAEQAEAAGKRFDLRLFATDVAEAVMATARAGQYPGSIALDVGEERLQRFFTQQDDTYCIAKGLREMITFAPQNLLQDPPFSRLDLISCRNLLIYLEPEAQKQVLGLFHFALREGGHLFLGSAETTSTQDDLFQPISKKWRIYRRVGPTRHDVVDFPLVGGRLLAGHGDSSMAAPAEPQVRAGDLMLQALADRFAPASALIDARCRVHYLRGLTENYLRPASGEPSHNLLAMARDGLQHPLRTAIHHALDKGQEITTDAQVRRGSALCPIRLIVTPVKAGRHLSGKLLVSFFERDGSADEPAAADVVTELDETGRPSELDTAREELRLSVEHTEAANEELKASNEEIRSINEELQASNEELETSKEELQSLNEELNTVNNQLQAKIGELEERTNDLNNLLNSTDIATLFLDRALCIRWFTPAMKALFELLPTDIGRPIANFAQRFSGGDLLKDAKKVLAKLAPIDAEVESDHGRWYIRHMLPYRTDDDRILGVAVTFTDITERKRAEEQLRKSEAFHRYAVEAGRVGTWDLELETNECIVSPMMATLMGYGRDRTVVPNAQWMEAIVPEDRPRIDAAISDTAGKGNPFDFTLRIQLQDGKERWLHSSAGVTRDDTGRALRMHGASIDVTARKRDEAALRHSAARLAVALEAIGAGVYEHALPIGKEMYHSQRWAEILGYRKQDLPAHDDFQSWFHELVHRDDREMFERTYTDFVEGRSATYCAEYRVRHEAGMWKWIRGFAQALDRDPAGRVTRIVGVILDVTAGKQMEEERELLTHELSHRVKNTLAVVQALARQTDGEARSVAEFRDAFLGRLHSLARAQNLLLDARWRSADLTTLVEQAVAAYRVDHPEVVAVEGEPVALTAKQGLGLSLILHELSTNAAKYGALSRHEGRLRISWQVENGDESRHIRLLWQERDGPEVGSPDGRGFGTQLIEQASAYELDGEAELNYAPEGLTCRIAFPLE